MSFSLLSFGSLLVSCACHVIADCRFPPPSAILRGRRSRAGLVWSKERKALMQRSAVGKSSTNGLPSAPSPAETWAMAFCGYAGCVLSRLLQVWGPTGLARWPGSAGRCRHAHSSSGWEVVYTCRHIYKLPRYSCHGGIGQKSIQKRLCFATVSSDPGPLSLPLAKAAAIVKSILLQIYSILIRTPKMT